MVLMGTVPEVPENLPRSFKVHRKMCSELMRLVDEVVNIFPEIEAARPRCSSGLQALCSLNIAIEKAKLLLLYCSESSKLYLAMTGNVIVSRCRKVRNMLEQSLGQIQNMVPVMLAVQISQVVDILRAAVFVLDSSEEEAGKVVLELLQPGAAVSGSTENAEAEAIQFAALRLGITSSKEILVEKRSIRNLLNKVGDSDQKRKKILKYLFHLLSKHGSLVLEKQTESLSDQQRGPTGTINDTDSDGFRYSQSVEVGRRVKHQQYEAQTDNLTRAIPPEEFSCPLSSRLMYDPVVIASGETFERVWIQKWFDEGNNTCPKTKKKLDHKFLTPNAAMRDLISKWCIKCGITISDPSVAHSLDTSSTSIASFGSFMNDLRIPGDISNMSLGSLDNSSTSDYSVDRFMKPEKNQSSRNFAMTVLEPLSRLGDLDWEFQCKLIEDVKDQFIHNSEAFDSLSSEDLLDPLVKFLSNARDLHNARAQKAGTQLLLEFVSRNRDEVHHLGEDEISLLTSFLDSAVTEEVLGIMLVLSEHPKCRSKLAASGALSSCLNILDSDIRSFQERAIRILSNLSSLNDVCSTLVSLNCIPKLVPYLSDKALARDSLAIFKNLSSNREARSAIVSTTGSIASIAEILETGSPKDQENAVSVLLSLCSESVQYCQVLMAEGDTVIPDLVSLSTNGTRKGKAGAMELLRLLRDIKYDTDNDDQPECSKTDLNSTEYVESDFIRTEFAEQECFTSDFIRTEHEEEKKPSRKTSRFLGIFVSRKKK